MRVRFGRTARRIVGAATLLTLALALWVLAIANERAHLEAPEPTLLLRDRNGRHLAELASGGDDAPLGFWRTEQTPARVAAAMIAIEDRRFREHWGVDVRAVGRAIVQNVRGVRRISGASTLAMQVARMMSPGPRTIPRKIVEAATAMILTARYGREAVLAHYLAIAPYGNRVHGIAYAARRYLDKPVEDLSWAEIAFLAAIPQSPNRMNPYEPAGRTRAIARGRRILDLLHAQSVLSDSELELARAQLVAISVPPLPTRPESALHFVLRAAERFRAHPPVDPLVITSLDLDLQEEAARAAEAQVASWTERGAENAALVVVDRETREVLAYVGSAGYFDADHAGAIDYADTPRMSGSTLKPFLYALALDRGTIAPSTILDDLRRAPGVTDNADHEFLGPLLPRVALASSRNVPAVNLLYAVGAHQTYELFADLGLHQRRVPYDFYGAGIAVGLLPVTLTDLVRAYGALANDGRLAELSFTAVAPGAHARTGRRIYSEEAARQLGLFLSDPLARLPTFPRMGASEYSFPVALKTGTTEGYRDAWTVAYSRRWILGAWVGRADAHPMTQLGGAQSAAKLVRQVLQHLHADDLQGLADLSFPPPRDHVPHKVCGRTGLLATPACDHTFVEWFPKGDEPTESCTAHVALTIDSATGQVATRDTPLARREVRTFTELAPRYAAWAAAHGLVPPPALARGRRVLGSSDERASMLADDSPLAAPKITEPTDGARLLRDPEAPPELSTLALSAEADPRAKEIVWVVDGKPFRTVAPPFTTRWPLAPGEHVIEARVPHAERPSRPVRVIVE